MTDLLDSPDLGLSPGKAARLHRILRRSGLRNGTAMLLTSEPDAGREPGRLTHADVERLVRLAFEGNFNAIALPLDLAGHYYGRLAGELPLIAMINDGDAAGSDPDPDPAVSGPVADAVQIGADAIGYSICADSPLRDDSFTGFSAVKEEAGRYGLPLFTWVHARGSTVEAMGGGDSLFAVDYSVRTARKLGTDVAIVTSPHADRQTQRPGVDYAGISAQEAVNTVVRTARHTLLLVAIDVNGDAGLGQGQARQAMTAGATGVALTIDPARYRHALPAGTLRPYQQILSRYCR